MTKKILIIEDEEVLLDILTKKLQGHGFEVLAAKDGSEGLEHIRRKEVDLILLDMLMPKIDGYEVLETMKNEEIKIPVIIVSNSGQQVDVEKAMALGACDYIVKAELNPDEIVSKVNHCLGGGEAGASSLEVKTGEQDKGGEEEKKKLKGSIIVLAEDDQFLRELCAKKMEKLGYRIERAVDGIEAYEKIISTKPDLVLLDIIMPGMEGFEILKKVRSHEDKDIANLPVIILSNLGQEEDVKKGLDLGANDYLVKANFTIDEIVERMKKFLK